MQRWLGRNVKHRRTRLLASSFATSSRWTWGLWNPIELDRSERLSFYFCSGYSLGGRVSTDIAGVGGC